MGIQTLEKQLGGSALIIGNSVPLVLSGLKPNQNKKTKQKLR